MTITNTCPRSMVARSSPALLVALLLSGQVTADELDDPPTPDQDPYCLARKAAREAYLRGISNVPVTDGQLCPPDPEVIRLRDSACRAEKDPADAWGLINDGLNAGSSMLEKGVPFVIELLGDPSRIETEDGFWDIDIFEIPRTLFFPGVTVKTRDYISDAVNFDTSTGTVDPTDAIYEMTVTQGNFQFAHGLTLESTRDDVEAALGLPCAAVAHYGRTAVREQHHYGYSDWSDAERARYSVTFQFDDSGSIESVSWYWESVWH